MNRFFTIFSFTFKEAIRNKGFIISTIITLVIFFGLANMDKIIKIFDDGSKDKVLVMQNTKEPLVDEKFLDTFDNDDYDFILNNNISDLDKEKESLKSGESDLKGICLIENKGDISGKLFVKSEGRGNLEEKVNEIVNGIKVSFDIKNFKLSPEEYTKLMTPATVEVIEEGNSSSGRMVIVYILVFMLYGSMAGLGGMVANSVLEEKTNRIMESLITMAKPLELFFGKVLGICAVGLVQVGITIVAGIVMVKNSAMANELLEKANVDYKVILAFAVFFLIGYLTFALLYGALGSLATNMQDANSAMGGVTLVIVAVFVIAIQCLFNIDTTAAVVLSYLPFSSPLVMFERVILSNVSVAEMALSIGLNIVYILGIGWLSSKIYKRGTLHYGTKMSLIKVIKDMKK